MPTNLVGRTEMPAFNILGLLLGGRGYAADYFAKKDALEIARQQRGERGDFAQDFLNSPEYKAGVTDPQKQAQYSIWARQQYGPEAIANTGNSILMDQLQNFDAVSRMNLDDKLQQTRMRLQQQQQQQNFDYSHRLDLQRLDRAHELQLKETTFSQDERIRAEDEIRNRAAAAEQAERKQLLENLSGQTLQNTSYDMAAKKYGLPARPSDQDAVTGPDGNIRFVPAPGSENYRKATGELQNIQSLGGHIDELSDMMDMNRMDFGRAKVLTTLAGLDLKNLKELGTLDQGTIDTVNKLISEYGQYAGYGVNTQEWKIAREKLRVMKQEVNRGAAQWGDRWGRDPTKEENRAYKSRMGDIPPAPTTPAIPRAVEGPARSRSDPRPVPNLHENSMNFPGSRRRQ